MLCDGLEEWDGGGGWKEDVCICIADSLQCTAETNTRL